MGKCGNKTCSSPLPFGLLSYFLHSSFFQVIILARSSRKLNMVRLIQHFSNIQASSPTSVYASAASTVCLKRYGSSLYLRIMERKAMSRQRKGTHKNIGTGLPLSASELDPTHSSFPLFLDHASKNPRDSFDRLSRPPLRPHTSRCLTIISPRSSFRPQNL